ncbi:MAG: HIT domain-containing protein [Candidatus Woesearchaeota archaeon]|nr:HIT domain-containing protein [Candidatus Woesearchaeota archaeon]
MAEEVTQEQMTQEQMLEEQKKNCIFCRIVKGEMEGKKVFENDRFLAILDIRPAVAGHILLMPKEHVPILPLLPPSHLQELFELTAKLSAILRDVLVKKYVTVFAASGYAAGQQAPHLMLHLIPRDDGDGLNILEPERNKEQPDAVALTGFFEQATQQALAQLGRGDLLGDAQPPEPQETPPEAAPMQEDVLQEQAQPEASERTRPVQQESLEEATGNVLEFENKNDAVESLLADNPELKKLIIAEPSQVAAYIEQSEKLKKLFEGVDINALSVALRRQEERNTPLERAAKDMTQEELFKFIDGNEGLRTWLLEQPEELAKNIGQNPKLHAFFEGTDIMELAKKYKEYKHA